MDLPFALINDRIKQDIKPGKILHIDIPFHADHPKFYLVGATKENKAALFPINSVKNGYESVKPLIKIDHLLLYKKDYGFITKECYLDCGYMIELDYDAIIKGMKHDPGNIKDALSDYHFNDMKRKVKQTERLTGKQKKLYGLK